MEEMGKYFSLEVAMCWEQTLFRRLHTTKALPDSYIHRTPNWHPCYYCSQHMERTTVSHTKKTNYYIGTFVQR